MNRPFTSFRASLAGIALLSAALQPSPSASAQFVSPGDTASSTTPPRESAERGVSSVAQAPIAGHQFMPTIEAGRRSPAPPQTIGGPSTCGDPTLTQSATPNEIEARVSIVCTDTGVSSENSYARSFTVPAEGFIVSCVAFGIEANIGGAWPTKVRLLTGGPITGPYDNLTLLAETIVNIPNGGGPAFYTADFAGGVPYPGGSQLIVELNWPSRLIIDGGDGGLIAPGCNNNGETAPSYIRAAACGVPNFVPLASIGQPNVHLAMTVAASAGGACCYFDTNGQVACQRTFGTYCETVLGGVYQGLNTTCASVNCDGIGALIGACCYDFFGVQWFCEDSSTGMNQATCENSFSGYWTPAVNCAAVTCQVSYPECDPNIVAANPSFEINQLLTYGAIYGNFALNQSIWGAESGTLVAAGTMIPYGGTTMHRMNPNQAW